MPYILVDNNEIIEAISDHPIEEGEKKLIYKNKLVALDELIGGRVGTRRKENIRLAVVCNWRQQCGISTYSQYLVESLRPIVKELKIFSEDGGQSDFDKMENVERCWKRGESLKGLLARLKSWKPDFILVQHEFGIFPSATSFLQLLYGLAPFPYAVTLHSVYEHLDKTIHTSAIKNLIVHTSQARENLQKLGHEQPIYVITHGCVLMDDAKELWNTFQNPYVIMQFGFGFFYKGVDRAIDAVAHLKNTDTKFKNIFYCYLCSQSPNAQNTHSRYVDFLTQKIKDLGVEDNVAIIQKYHSEKIINNYLRTAKIAVFPYTPDPKNIVYGASGAIRIALANKIPVIASESHMFDDVEGVVPRPSNHLELAKEIDEIFSNDKYRNRIQERSAKYIHMNNWDITADRYLDVMGSILKQTNCLEP